MTQKYSRGQWSQITARVKQAKFIFDPTWRCFIDGKRFDGHECVHSVEENELVAAKVKSEALQDS